MTGWQVPPKKRPFRGSKALIIIESTYYYDPFGRRLWKEVAGIRTYFVYADEGLVAEVDAAGNVIKSYGYKPGSTWTTDPLFMKVEGQYYFYQNDHLGTPQKLTAVNGAVMWSAKYSSFGEGDVDLSSTITNNLRFPGQYFDQETGFNYNYFRYYNYSIGRYFRPDPIGFDGGINLYVYVLNNPVNWTDELGLRNPLGIPFGMGVPGLDAEGRGFQRAAENVVEKSLDIVSCTALCLCGIGESDWQKTKNKIRALSGATKITLTGKVLDWEVPVDDWQKFAKKAGKTTLKKVAIGAGVISVMIWTYDIGRCSIKCTKRVIDWH